MKITEWFCRAVEAGLMPECNYAFAEYSESWHGVKEWSIYTGMTENCRDTILVRNVIEKPDDEDARVFLRKDGKDLYSLEWRKPTEQDVGKMCWFLSEDNNTIFLTELTDINVYEDLEDDSIYDIFYQYETDDSCFDSQNCLLADYGQIAPTEADFKQVYGE